MPSQIIVPPQGITNSALLGVGHFYRTLFTPPQGFIISEQAPLDWFNTLWRQRISLTVNPVQVPSTQTDFPMLIFSTFPSLIGRSIATLRFADTDKLQLEYEIQKFDNSTGELIAWVKKPTIDNGDTIYLYYDNPAALDEQDPPAVWDVNYKARYSMKNNALLDSTSNAQDLTHFGSPDIAGKIGGAQRYFSSITQYAIRNPFTGFPSTEITTEFWAKTGNNNRGVISYANTSTTNAFLVADQGNLQVFVNSVMLMSGVSFNDDLFHHIVSQWRSSDGAVLIYVDGNLSFSSTGTAATQTILGGGSLVLAQDQDTIGGGFEPAMAYGGILDEVRISDVMRSADNIKTTFNNHNDPELFYSIGAVETLPLDMCYEDLDIMTYEDGNVMGVES